MNFISIATRVDRRLPQVAELVAQRIADGTSKERSAKWYVPTYAYAVITERWEQHFGTLTEAKKFARIARRHEHLNDMLSEYVHS